MSGRREFLRRSLAASASSLALPCVAPAIVVAERDRPLLTHGVAAGDVCGERGVVWSRADRPARMVVEWDTSDRFVSPRRVEGPAALPETGLTAQVDLTGLPPGEQIVYRVRFQDLADLRRWSEPVAGRFRSAPEGPADVVVIFSADTCGQGWGIDAARGGLRLYQTMRREAADLFVHCGDTIYADQPLTAEVALDDGSVWRNRMSPAKAKVAETLDEFRGNYLYNLADEHMRGFNAEVAQVLTWDDHEVRDNWQWEQRLERDERYRVKSLALLAAHGRRAFLEHQPIRPARGDPQRIHRRLSYGPRLEVFVLDLRSHRAPNSANRQPQPGPASALLGASQLGWLEQGLAASRATWKLVVSSQPLGLVVPDSPGSFEAVANDDGGPPLGREQEIARLLSFLRRHDVRNVVWLTGDVHYCAAHRYDPERARFRDFLPFWEFVAGPLHAGTFGPNPLDGTFGPEVRFVGVPQGMKPNRPPSEGLQFYGSLRIAGTSGALTARLHDLSGRTLFQQELEPERTGETSR